MAIVHAEIRKFPTAQLTPGFATWPRPELELRLQRPAPRPERQPSTVSIPKEEREEIVRQLVHAQPVVRQMGSIRAEFESWIGARGAALRNPLFQRLLSADPELILAVGLDQYALHGNGDRLQLTADLLSAAGRRSYPALKAISKSYRPELIYFVDSIASSSDLHLEERADLLNQIATFASADSELFDRLDAALGWVPSAIANEIRRKCDFDPASVG